MSDHKGYGQFCPVAKAAEILTTRWTPLILRELISGSTGFNEIHRGVPLMSRPLLARRLRELTAADVIVHDEHGGYRLTESGRALKPIIIAMGLWGQQWVESATNSADWDAGVLMWDMHRRIDTGALPPGRTVLQFDYSDAPTEMTRWWLLIEDDEVSLCQSDPGFEVDLYLASSVRILGPVWIGQRRLDRAIERGDIRVHGRADLVRSLSSWLLLSVIAEQAEQRPGDH